MVQKCFIDEMISKKQLVSIIVMNGYRMKGKIIKHDKETILLDVYGQRHLIYKSAISTIVDGVQAGDRHDD